MLSFINVQAGLAATGLCLGGLGIAAAVALVTAPITPRYAVADTVSPPRSAAPSQPLIQNAIIGGSVRPSRPSLQPVATTLSN